MKFWKRFSGAPKEEASETKEDAYIEPSSEESQNTLDLGWYWSENKKKCNHFPTDGQSVEFYSALKSPF